MKTVIFKVVEEIELGEYSVQMFKVSTTHDMSGSGAVDRIKKAAVEFFRENEGEEAQFGDHPLNLGDLLDYKGLEPYLARHGIHDFDGVDTGDSVEYSDTVLHEDDVWPDGRPDEEEAEAAFERLAEQIINLTQRSGEEIKLINDYGIVWEIDPDDPAKLRGEYKGQAIARHPSCYAVEGVPYDSLSEAVAAIDQSR